jgi:hypothetical protein
VIVLLAGGAALLAALIVLGVLGYELLGHLRRLRRAVDAARADLLPRLARLTPPASAGRHRAGTGADRLRSAPGYLAPAQPPDRPARTPTRS